MQVETFECSETASEPIEACEEAVGIIEALGLKGQMALVRAKGECEPAARLPYREITVEENFAYRVLCPYSFKLKDYSRSPIPLRVLQIASHAQALGLFDDLVVWDRESVAVKDPVLIATAPGITYSWQKRTFILARWGEVLEPLAVLIRRACDIKREQFRAFTATLASQAIAEQAFVESVQNDALIKMGPDASYSMSVPR